MPKALALLSGGLDSTLAAALLKAQGVPLHGLSFVSLFTAARSVDGRKLASMRAAEILGIPLTIVSWPPRLIEIIKAPSYGYGSNMNPCIDCRMAVLTMARERMAELGCDFVITGEVLGERPMSQRRQPMEMVQARSGLGKLLLRPLSAQLLAPTLPEERGWVDRSRLGAIRGRSRKPQMQLAAELGISEYPTPAGGCKLTDPGFSVRLRDLMDHCPDWDVNDAHLLKVGRHFRLAPQARSIVGRNEHENGVIASYARQGDILLEALSFPGPLTLLRGAPSPEDLRLAASITAAYGKGRNVSLVAVAWRTVGGESGTLNATPADPAQMARCRLETPPGPSDRE